jgi:hypothetical protein
MLASASQAGSEHELHSPLSTIKKKAALGE